MTGTPRDETSIVDLAGRIKNLTNERYAGWQSSRGQYPQPERNYEASITYRF
jgi:iron complex outermembrane receptor protein